MQFRHSVLCFFIIVFVSSCQGNGSLKNGGQLGKETILPSTTANYVDSNFYQFLKRFYEDSNFQFHRVLFPLKIKQYSILNGEDTVFYRQQNEYKRITFQKESPENETSEWKQNIVLDSSRKTATVEITGIDNGIMVNYLFERREGKWMLIKVDDSST